MGQRDQVGRHPHRLMFNSKTALIRNPKIARKMAKELPVGSNHGPSRQAPQVW